MVLPSRIIAVIAVIYSVHIGIWQYDRPAWILFPINNHGRDRLPSTARPCCHLQLALRPCCHLPAGSESILQRHSDLLGHVPRANEASPARSALPKFPLLAVPFICVPRSGVHFGAGVPRVFRVPWRVGVPRSVGVSRTDWVPVGVLGVLVRVPVGVSRYRYRSSWVPLAGVVVVLASTAQYVAAELI